MALKTVGSNPTIHPTDLTPPVNKIWRSFHYQISFRNIWIFRNVKIDNKLNIGVSSSGKTQHFDCCIRRFESCHPSQKITDTKLCLLFFLFSFSAGFEPISPSFAKQKGHINCCKRQGLPCRILPPQPRRRKLHIACGDFFIASHSFRCSSFPQKSRSARLFGCKRPHDGSLSLPTFADYGQPHFQPPL